jgi:hypothetical protein
MKDEDPGSEEGVIGSNELISDTAIVERVRRECNKLDVVYKGSRVTVRDICCFADGSMGTPVTSKSCPYLIS